MAADDQDQERRGLTGFDWFVLGAAALALAVGVALLVKGNMPEPAPAAE